jgi:hypothetical protein
MWILMFITYGYMSTFVGYIHHVCNNIYSKNIKLFNKEKKNEDEEEEDEIA